MQSSGCFGARVHQSLALRTARRGHRHRGGGRVSAPFERCQDIGAPGRTIANAAAHDVEVDLYLERLCDVQLITGQPRGQAGSATISRHIHHPAGAIATHHAGTVPALPLSLPVHHAWTLAAVRGPLRCALRLAVHHAAAGVVVARRCGRRLRRCGLIAETNGTPLSQTFARYSPSAGTGGRQSARRRRAAGGAAADARIGRAGHSPAGRPRCCGRHMGAFETKGWALVPTSMGPTMPAGLRQHAGPSHSASPRSE